MPSISAMDPSVARDARRVYVDTLAQGLPGLAERLIDGARERLDAPAEPPLKYTRGETLRGLMRTAASWQSAVVNGLYTALHETPAGAGVAAQAMPASPLLTLSLVEEDTIEREILVSRLDMAVMDAAGWEFSDLRARLSTLEQHRDPGPEDVVRSGVLARLAMRCWIDAGHTLEGWRDLQPVLHREVAALVVEAYHETNRWLLQQGVLKEVDLRPFIRVAAAGRTGIRPSPSGFGSSPSSASGPAAPGSPQAAMDAAQAAQALHRLVQSLPQRRDTSSAPYAATEVMPMPPLPTGSPDTAGAALHRLSRLAGGLPGEFDVPPGGPTLTPRLMQAIDAAQAGLRDRPVDPTVYEETALTMPVVLKDLDGRKHDLKSVAGSDAERATIEIVALMFQSLFTEDRIPPRIRVWFARLQMPVLRVAVTEPDFFAALDHPARQLIDRMGSVCMGLAAGDDPMIEALEKEIKRVVQVVEAYPDTGRRVFQTVLTEFEQFLKNYLSTRNEATREAVSVAQQVEQRETLAIQYTIELRRMLNEMPVQEGVRQFLFHVWADVLAITSMNHGPQSDPVRQAKRTALDLIWSASAKVNREERTTVIGKVPALLRALRDGMAAAGIDADRQDEQIRALNNSLAAAFTAKAAVIPRERFSELLEQLETLEEMLPDAAEAQEEIDESMMHDLSVGGKGQVEVMRDAGVEPSAAMLAWARELQVGTWYELQFADATEPMQLAWQGLRKQLSLFVNSKGRCALFQLPHLAAYLQCGRLQPAQDEALTVRATRHALARLEADPSALLN